MMEILQSGQYPEYLTFCEKMGAHFMQIPNWSRVKSGWESKILVRREAGEICAGVLLLRRKVGPFCLIYAPRGPVCDLEHLEKLMEDVLRYAKQRRACCLKIDPHVPAEQAEYAARLQALGFTQIPAGAMGNTQPKFVYQIRIAHRDAGQILQSFAPKTRYNVRVAGRRGVQIWRGGSERVSEFYPLLVETGQRDGFVVRQMQYYRNLLDQMGEYAQLFLAEYEGKPIAGAIAVWFGKHAWYLYGASSKARREAMPNYLMQYQMMLWAREKGCEIYDMRGISGDLREDNPLYGLYRFKKGFGDRGGWGIYRNCLASSRSPSVRWPTPATARLCGCGNGISRGCSKSSGKRAPGKRNKKMLQIKNRAEFSALFWLFSYFTVMSSYSCVPMPSFSACSRQDFHSTLGLTW